MSKLELQRTQELTRAEREAGKQGAWNGYAQVASRAKAVPEEYGPDAERQEVRGDEQEFRTAQQQVEKMTQARARSEGSSIINEYKSDKTMPNDTVLTATDVEKSFLERNKERGRQLIVRIWRKSINHGTAIDEFSNPKPIVKKTAKHRDEEQTEQRKDRGQSRGCIRCEHERDTMQMPETTSAQEVPQRITTQRRNSRRSSCEAWVEMQDITREYKVVNYVDKKTWS